MELEVNVEDCRSLIRLLPADSHLLAAGKGSHSAVLGPSIVTLTSESRVFVRRRLRKGVLIRFTAEKTRSTSAEDAGSTATLARSDAMRG